MKKQTKKLFQIQGKINEIKPVKINLNKSSNLECFLSLEKNNFIVEFEQSTMHIS